MGRQNGRSGRNDQRGGRVQEGQRNDPMQNGHGQRQTDAQSGATPKKPGKR